MASSESHIEKAKHNIQTVAFLSTDLTKKDWIVTVSFYAALHIVDAILYHTQESYSKHGQSHDSREKILKSDNRFKKIWECYRPLSNHSIIARYLQGNNTPPDVTVDFEKVMPNDKLIIFIKERLGGLINSTTNLIPSNKDLGIKEVFQSELKQFLGL